MYGGPMFTTPEACRNLIGMQGRGEGTAQTFAVPPGMGKSSANALTQNLSFELGEHSQQGGHGTARRRSQIQSLG